MGGEAVFTRLPVVTRLNRDRQINLILGFLLPFLVPALLKIIALTIALFSLSDPHRLIWAVSAWAFLPANLLDTDPPSPFVIAGNANLDPVDGGGLRDVMATFLARDDVIDP
jgi:hypothetical protein